MDTEAVNLFLAISRCHGLMKEKARKASARSDVKAVKHWSDMYNVNDAFRLEEYVDVEQLDGQATSWRLEMALTLETAAVEADVRRIHENGQDVLVEIADSTYATMASCATGIVEITRRLCAASP